jgi:protease I
MSRIAFLVGENYEDSEFRVPFERLREVGHQLTVVGKKAGETVHGKKDDTVVTQKHGGEVSAKDFDGLVIPGGYSPDDLRTQRPLVEFTRDMVEAGKPVGAICHAGSLLVEADVVMGKRVTSWPSIRRDLENAGAVWENEAVVEDGNLITSRHPGDLEEFCNALIRHLGPGSLERAAGAEQTLS